MAWPENEDRRSTPTNHELDIRLIRLESTVTNLAEKLDDINKNLTWLVRIVLAGLIGGVMTLLFQSGGAGLT